MTKTVYLIGSLRNPEIPKIAETLRQKTSFEIFDDWFSAGEHADDAWRDYEKARGHTYQEALESPSAKHVFGFDTFNLNRSHAGVLVYPAGKSGHLELGYLVGTGKPGFILLDGVPDRFDVMKQFATGGVYTSVEDLSDALISFDWDPTAEIPRISAHDAMWLAGLLEGEGSFVCDSMNGRSRPRPRIALQMTDEDIVGRAASLLGARVWGPYKKKSPRKPVWATAVTGPKAVEWMRILCPYMGERRQLKIREIISAWNPRDYRRWRKLS